VNGTGPGSGGVTEIREDQPHEAHELAHDPRADTPGPRLSSLTAGENRPEA
jgi:hypothetical protein